ncbi:LysR family transcriptional regulator [Belnapia sp. T18]|uniref:LysR family transcriptional regulator n=1 Tax=Belnapia arida TaxID=2804533 RepID=A0ABS1UCF2_9PROT|nr:LysR substrate-binding domain-containing protein [Belnapia arida]MBL6082367.1 LysR family transcriptional regulator [Belnapia arida]
MRLLDPDLLRTFLAFADAGTLARAAAAVGRTPSAVTAQVQRLEADLGTPLLAAAGRGRVLTEAGEALLPHARRILDAHRDARLAVSGVGAAEPVALGVTQDFADTALPDLLRAFAVAHPKARLDLRVGRSAALLADLAVGRIDLALVMRGGDAIGEEVAVLHEPMRWLCARDGLAVPVREEVPLAVLDPPCGFRDAALDTLARAGRAHRIAATSPSLAGLRAAVRAGLAVTARTGRLAGAGVGVAPRALALPPLPEAEFSLRLRRSPGAEAARLAELLADGLRNKGTILDQMTA